jgi:hypothetical protein
VRSAGKLTLVSNKEIHGASLTDHWFVQPARIISHVQVFFSVVFLSSILFNNQLFITIRACNRTPKRKEKKTGGRRIMDGINASYY